MRQNHKDKRRTKSMVKILDNDNLVIMPTLPQEKLKHYIIKYSDKNTIKRLTDNEDYEALSSSIIHAMSYSMVAPNDVFKGKFTTMTATNDYSLNGKPLHNHSLEMKKTTGRITGKNIKYKVNSKLGIQSNEKVYLWNTGCWVVIGNIRNVDIISLSTRLAKSLSVIGTSTTGLIYSHESIIYHKVLLQFIEEHILATNLDTGVDDILTHISIYDLDSLIVGLITCLKPEGYDSLLLCKNQYDKNNETMVCDYVARTKLQPSTLIYTSKPLSNKQKTIIGSPNVTLEDLELYKEELTTFDTVKIIDDVEISMHVPTIMDYLSMGDSWILRLNDMVNSALGKESEDIDRDTFLEELNNSLSLNWYNHWVTHIQLDKDSYIEGKLDIVEALDTLSADIDIALPILEAISKFIDNNSISIAGVATFTCPTCKKKINEKDKKKDFEFITPINTLQLFLATSTHR